jgi:hypothetical protein
MSYFTGKPTDMFESAVGAYKGGLGSCCAACASGKPSCSSATGDISVSTNVIGFAALVGIAWLTIKSMKRVAR